MFGCLGQLQTQGLREEQRRGSSDIPLAIDLEVKPIGSMYGIYTYIYHNNQPNIGKYAIHGWYGKICFFWEKFHSVSKWAVETKPLAAIPLYWLGVQGSLFHNLILISI